MLRLFPLSRRILLPVVAAVVVVALAGCGARQPAQGNAGRGVESASSASQLARPAPDPDVRQYSFSEVDLNGVPADYKSTRWVRRSKEITVERDSGGGLRCQVVGGSESGPQYGGVKFPMNGMKALRLELTLLNPDDISGIHVDGYDAERKRVLR